MPTWNSATSTLQNPFMTIQLESKHGGRIVSLHGPGGELTRAADSASLQLARVPYKFGLLSVQLWQDSYWHNDLCHVDWPITGTANGTGFVDVTLSGASVLWSGVAVNRTYHLTDDPWIDVRHTLDPGSTTQPYMPPSFWFSNAMSGLGTTFVPGPTGVVDLPRFPQDQSWCHEPTDGWIGWVQSHGNGLALTTGAAHLRHVRIGHLQFDRVEWIRRRLDTVEQDTVRLIPFSGLTRVDGVGNAGVVGVRTAPNGVEVQLYPTPTGRALISLWAGPQANPTAHFGSAIVQVTSGHPVTVLLQPQLGTRLVSYGWWNGSVQIGAHPGAVTTFRLPIAEGFRRDLRSVAPAVTPVVELPRADGAHRQPPRSFLFDALPVPLPDWGLARPVNTRLRVLALVPIECGPSLLALAQRFSFQLTYPFIPAYAQTPTNANGIAGQRLFYELGDRYDGTYGDELINVWTAALATANTYDVILISVGASDPWSLLPQNLQADILNRVQAGTGLVLVNRDLPGGPNPETTTLRNLLPLAISNTSNYGGPWHVLNDRTVRGLPWTLMGQPGYIYSYALNPAASVLLELEYGTVPPTLMPLLARSQYGTGRVLQLAWGAQLAVLYRPTPPGGEGFENFRYDLDLLGRIVFDAANRPPAIAVQNVTLSGSVATVQLEQVVASANTFDLDWQARDRFGALMSGGRQTFNAFPAGNSVSLTVPAGSWACDVLVTPTTGDSGWGAGAQAQNVSFTVSPTLPAYERSQPIQVTPTLPAGATHVLVDLVDGRGRICARVDVLAGGTANHSFTSVTTPSAELRLHAVNAVGELVGQGFLKTRVKMRAGFDRWPAHFWNSPLSLPHWLQVRRLDANRSLGVPGYFLVGDPGDELIAAADRIATPYVVQSSGWLYTSGGQTQAGAGSPISLTDAVQTSAGQAGDRAIAGNFAAANVLFYRVADDEPDPPKTDVCFAPRTLDWFRSWLSQIYGHSDLALQAAWGPGANLAGATPTSYANAITQFATTGTYAPWVDHRRFMMNLFSAAPSWARTALRQSDPFALVGTSGDNVGGVAEGRDWWVRGTALDVAGRYGTDTRFNLAELGTLSIPWTGYDDPDPIIRYRVASAFGLGDPACALFAESTLVNPDLSLAEVGRDLAAALLPTRRGIGSLFARSTFAPDGVFVMSSPDSSAVLAIHGFENLGSWVTGSPPVQVDLGMLARETVHELLGTVGVGWRSINPIDVEMGALDRNSVRVLILPMCAALSDAACEAIRRWVDGGGFLIADLLPGVFTEHGRLRGSGIDTAGRLLNSTNALDPVFGLTVGAKPAVAASTITIGTTSFPVNCADTSVGAVGTATAAGSTGGGQPAWFANRYGLGTAHYLGCSFFSDFPTGDPSQPAQRLAMEEQFTLLIAAAGISRHAQINVANSRAADFRLWIRQYGAAELVVVARNYVVAYPMVAPELDGTLTFASSAHTYDMDEGTYLGFGYRLAIRVHRYAFRTLARLPYRVLGVTVTPGGAIVLGQVLTLSVQLQVSAGTPGLHLIRIDLIDGNHHPIDDLSREIPVTCGTATTSIPTALNDPIGPWTVLATDLLTGIQARASISITGAVLQIAVPAVTRVLGIDD
jgi:hypothetical protein